MLQPVGLTPEQRAKAALSVLKTLNVMNPGSKIAGKCTEYVTGDDHGRFMHITNLYTITE